ncbi:MAG: sugar phosphate nucleotidyltransferase [Candidatus Cryptobacteroides sp.]
MKAMVFAAGLGTRLRPLTDTLPKALVPVDGVPLIEIVLRKLLSNGFGEAVVNVHHFAAMICDWVESQELMNIMVSDERDRLLDTGGGIYHAKRFLEGDGAFLVHNVDILSNADLRSFADSHRSDALATLLVSPRESSRHFLFRRDDMRLAGWENVKTGERIMLTGISPSDCMALSFSGIHIVSDAVFPAMEDYIVSMSLTACQEPTGQLVGKGSPIRSGMTSVDSGMTSVDSGMVLQPRFPIRDFYLWAARMYPIYGINDPGLRLLDVGKVGSLKQASDFLSTC